MDNKIYEVEELVDKDTAHLKIILILFTALILFFIKPVYCLLFCGLGAVIAIFKDFRIGLFILGGLSFTQIASLEILESYRIFLLCFFITFFSYIFFLSKELQFKIRIDPIYKWLLLFYIVILLSGIYAESSRYLQEEVYSFGRAFLLFFMVIQAFDDEKSFYIMGKVIILLLVFSSIFLFVDFIAHNYGGLTILFMRFYGGVGDPNDFAMLLNIVFPLSIFFVKHERKIIAKILFGICTLCLTFFLIASQSRGGIIAFVISLLAILWMSKNRIKIFIIFAVIIFIILTILPIELIVPRLARLYNIFSGEALFDPSFLQRLTLYRSALDVFLKSPILGVGANNFIVHSVRYITRPLFAHNVILEIAADLGIMGLVPFLVILLSPFLQFSTIIKDANSSGNNKFADYIRLFRISFVAMIITSLFLSCQTKTYLWIMIGLAYSIKFVDYRKVESLIQV